MADAADKHELYLQHARVTREKFLRWTSNTVGITSGIQQAGAPETAAKAVTPCFCLQLVTTSAQIQVCISLSPTFTRNINLR